jgi:hypothetical protein
MAYVKCPHCGKHTSNLAPCCVFCKSAVEPPPVLEEPVTIPLSFSDFKPCPKCGAPVKKAAYFCKYCGFSLDGSLCLRGTPTFLP